MYISILFESLVNGAKLCGDYNVVQMYLHSVPLIKFLNSANIHVYTVYIFTLR